MHAPRMWKQIYMKFGGRQLTQKREKDEEEVGEGDVGGLGGLEELELGQGFLGRLELEEGNGEEVERVEEKVQ